MGYLKLASSSRRRRNQELWREAVMVFMQARWLLMSIEVCRSPAADQISRQEDWKRRGGWGACMFILTRWICLTQIAARSTCVCMHAWMHLSFPITLSCLVFLNRIMFLVYPEYFTGPERMADKLCFAQSRSRRSILSTLSDKLAQLACFH